MIKVIENYLTDDQCNLIIDLWDNKGVMDVNDGIYHFTGVDLMNHLNDVYDIVPELSKCDFKKFRIQCVDESIIQVKTSHNHINDYSFVVFLNDNFTGGELIFDNQTIIPKTGTMVYFTGDMSHRVENCIGKRWTLVGFLNNDIFKTKNTKLL